MIAFGIGFALWCIAIVICLVEDVRTDSEKMGLGKAAFVATLMAYIFWGIGWALAWVADVIKLAVI
jgi:hypothetical protein